jgi:hypothetical protein
MWAWLLLVSCKQAVICEDLCRDLVVDCNYAAFPSLQSCEEGCAYNEKQGADIEGQLSCVEKANCDTFLIVECEHRFGPPEE